MKTNLIRQLCNTQGILKNKKTNFKQIATFKKNLSCTKYIYEIYAKAMAMVISASFNELNFELQVRI